eukprot:12574681-Alexandrium_andersonii.AAC.1
MPYALPTRKCLPLGAALVGQPGMPTASSALGSGGCKGAATKGQWRFDQFSAALGRFKQF